MTDLVALVEAEEMMHLGEQEETAYLKNVVALQGAPKVKLALPL